MIWGVVPLHPGGLQGFGEQPVLPRPGGYHPLRAADRVLCRPSSVAEVSIARELSQGKLQESLSQIAGYQGTWHLHNFKAYLTQMCIFLLKVKLE